MLLAQMASTISLLAAWAPLTTQPSMAYFSVEVMLNLMLVEHVWPQPVTKLRGAALIEMLQMFGLTTVCCAIQIDPSSPFRIQACAGLCTTHKMSPTQPC